LFELGSYIGLYAYQSPRFVSGNHTDSGASVLPRLWQQPPIASASDDITGLISPHARTLEESRQVLSNALRAAGFDEVGVYDAPGGFMLVTKVERIHADGSSFQGKERWTSEKEPLRSLSLAEYLKALFLEKPGQFRLMAFVVSTGFETTDRTKILTEEFARRAVVRGARGELPEDIASKPLAGHKCQVLIYHFEKRPGGGVRVLLPSELSAQNHLAKAQLLARLGAGQ
jgi:hypothetical protein